jgi:hypothetical protein
MASEVIELASQKRIGAIIFGGLTSLLVIFPLGLWSTLALWFRAPGPQWVRAIVAAVFALLALITIFGLFSARRWRALGGFALAFVALLMWWSTIQPPAERDWAPEVAHQVTGVVDGDILTLTNQRDFDWTSEKTAAEKWVTQSYDLSKLRKLDIFLAYWAGPEMTHPIMSFEFADGRHLAWSIEVRSARGGEFSPIANLFKADPLVFLASDERDMVRLRSNIRREDVQLYRLNTPPDVARVLLLEYVEQSNALAVQPRFFNSITTNCTTSVWKLIRAAGGKMPFDWRLIVNGYLPSFLYDRGAVDTSIPLDELVRLARIGPRAQEADRSPEFSKLIRLGVPSPRAITALK